MTAYRPGQRVAVAPNMGCGVCADCVAGNTHLCRTYEALGINLDGGFAEYIGHSRRKAVGTGERGAAGGWRILRGGRYQRGAVLRVQRL